MAVEFVEARVTDCAELKVPAGGSNVGVPHAPLIAYDAEPTAELLYPALTAMALRVSVTATVTATVYRVELVVGVEPSVV
jgi:hypothetical protein